MSSTCKTLMLQWFLLLCFRQRFVCLVFFGSSVSGTHEHFNAVSMRLNVLTVQLNSLKSQSEN